MCSKDVTNGRYEVRGRGGTLVQCKRMSGTLASQ